MLFLGNKDCKQALILLNTQRLMMAFFVKIASLIN